MELGEATEKRPQGQDSPSRLHDQLIGRQFAKEWPFCQEKRNELGERPNIVHVIAKTALDGRHVQRTVEGPIFLKRYPPQEPVD